MFLRGCESSSYREQARTIALVNRLGEPGRRALREATGKDKAYHSIELKPVEIAMQRGVLSYFVEDIAVFKDAYLRRSISWPRAIEAAVKPRLDRIFDLWLLEWGIE
jgi:hypothetical protein